MRTGRRDRPAEARPGGEGGMDHGVEVERTLLPGIGIREAIHTSAGRRLGVITHRAGWRELVVYDRTDPDSCGEVVRLTDEEADALAEVLGAPRVVERLAALNEQVAALVTEQVRVKHGSPYDGRTLGETRVRTRTGASIVAVLRERDVIPSPTPAFRFASDDVLIVVGMPEAIGVVADILADG